MAAIRRVQLAARQEPVPRGQDRGGAVRHRPVRAAETQQYL